jgi:8-oxo-dGTP pyrophosphatase MutT (NUDIX family)
MTNTLTVPCKILNNYFGAAVLVLPSDRPGQVLVSYRHGCKYMNEMWAFPGGIVETEQAESAMAAAQRELFEEAGVFAPRSELDYLCTGVALSSAGEPFVTQFFVYCPKTTPQVKNTEPQKHGPWEWMLYTELRKKPVLPLIPMALEAYGFED